MKTKNNNQNKQFKWSEFFKIICIIIAIAGVVAVIVLTIKGYNVDETHNYALAYLFVSLIISVGIFMVFFGIYKAFVYIEEMQRKLKSLTDEMMVYKEKNNISEYWVCNCGKKNARYVGTCSCGKRKPNK